MVAEVVERHANLPAICLKHAAAVAGDVYELGDQAVSSAGMDPASLGLSGRKGILTRGRFGLRLVIGGRQRLVAIRGRGGLVVGEGVGRGRFIFPGIGSRQLFRVIDHYFVFLERPWFVQSLGIFAGSVTKRVGIGG